jgi:hypothetical protein
VEITAYHFARPGEAEGIARMLAVTPPVRNAA